MALDPQRWTVKTREAFQAATTQAAAAGNPYVTPAHLLLASMHFRYCAVASCGLGRTHLLLASMRARCCATGARAIVPACSWPRPARPTART